MLWMCSSSVIRNLSYKKIGKDVMLGNIIAIGFVIVIALATALAIYYTIKEILR